MSGFFRPLSGIGYPEELDILKKSFDRFCQEHNIEPDSSEAERIAQAVMSLFQAGVSDEETIRASLAEFQRRRIGRSLL